MRFVNIFIFVGLLLVSCGRKDGIRFYGETVVVEYPDRVETLAGMALELEGIYTGGMTAYDGILMLMSYKHPDGIVYVYDIETGQRINAMLRRGNGPDEVISVISSMNLERDSNGEFAIWFNDFNRDNLMMVNTRGEVLKRIETSQFKRRDQFLGRIFVLNDSLLIAYMQSESVFENGGHRVIAPRHRLFNYETGEMLREYKSYSDYKVNEDADFIVVRHLNSYDEMKPDRSKIAMVMPLMNKINILDIESGKVKSVAKKNSPNLNIVFSGRPVRYYYVDILSDNHCIYAMEGDPDQSHRFTGRINVFDWDGNFVKVLQIGEDATVFAFDPVRRMLYAKNDLEEITVYDLNFLYE